MFLRVVAAVEALRVLYRKKFLRFSRKA